MKLIRLSTVDSTNTYSKALDASLYEGGSSVVVVSEEQTGGRGRLGRSFFSPPGCGIYMSYSFIPAFPVEQYSLVTGITAAVVHRSLAEITGVDLAIKWVNDIYKRSECSVPSNSGFNAKPDYDRKVVGILAEVDPIVETGDTHFAGKNNHVSNRMVIGIGINVYEHELPDDIASKAGALLKSPNGRFMRDDIISDIADKLDEAMLTERLNATGYLEYYRSNSMLSQRNVTVLEHGKAPYKALVRGISDSFGLIISPEGGHEEIELTSGEISLDITADRQ